ncbi:quinone oxidoreductase [Mycobacterium sp.]|uniref:quinone oxidoreductase family protein n=1 Tax=Mycobacterium sp. TaxID=1785 RepID=UPI002C95CB0D|nr:quinone oxidoreductase [Mycobacterium sp.]HKP42991.1 quinone oxidoreductase [Mycobacterium sp.]
MRAAVITAYGGPENLVVRDVESPTPRPGNVLVRVEAAGLNFWDIIERRGRLPDQPPPPMRAGVEGAGTVVAAAADVPELAVGDRVMWAHIPGSHAQLVEVPAAETMPLPPWLSATDAAAVCVQGLTAHYLANSLRIMAAGDSALVWAAAGGVGRLLTQMLAAKGVRVIAAISSEAKAEAALAAGAERAVCYPEVEAAVGEMTGGGVDVVFDGVGAPTFDTSLACVRRRGMLVVYGNAGGPLEPVDLRRFFTAGSVYLVRPGLTHFIASREELLHRAKELFAAIERGELTVRVDNAYPLSEIADAHRAFESRAIVGKVVLLPQQGV